MNYSRNKYFIILFNLILVYSCSSSENTLVKDDLEKDIEQTSSPLNENNSSSKSESSWKIKPPVENTNDVISSSPSFEVSTPSIDISPTVSVSPSISVQPTITPTPQASITPNSTVTPSITPTVTPQPTPTATPKPTSSSSSSNDSIFADAFKNNKSNIQVKGSGRVTKLLSDDVDGDKHQKFILALSSGQTLLFAHNIDLAPRVPVKVGDSIEFYGEYEWNSQGGVIHWTHKDPDGSHEDGWIKLNGKIYQ
jgi:hypothetical protein